MVFYFGFNPTLVRLRLEDLFSDLPRLIAFQSHAGSIEALGKAYVLQEP